MTCIICHAKLFDLAAGWVWNENMRIESAFYIRLSPTSPSEAAQVLALNQAKRFLKTENFKIYKDRGDSEERPAFDKLIKDFAAGKVKRIATFSLDRFDGLTSLEAWLKLMLQIEDKGACFFAVQDRVYFASGSTIKPKEFLSAFNRSRMKLKIERLRQSQLSAKASGKHIGRPRIQQPEAVKDLRKQGLSIRAIATALNISVGAVQHALK